MEEKNIALDSKYINEQEVKEEIIFLQQEVLVHEAMKKSDRGLIPLGIKVVLWCVFLMQQIVCF